MKKRPNIVFFFTDQQRFDTCGCYGQRLPVTPNLDRLAQRGTLFENAFTCQPVCGPARACLQSGVYANQNGCFRNNIALPSGITTLADCFNSGGYKTAYVGKWHLASDSEHNLKTKPVPVERRGGYKDFWMAADVLEFTSDGSGGYVFDTENRRVDFKGYRADRITDYAIDFIDNVTDEQPFFLFLSHLEPHHQNNHFRFECPKGTRKLFRSYDVPGDLAGTAGDWRVHYPSYLASCAALDANLGRVVKALEKKNILDNTVIVFTSDHGCHFRTRNSEYKRSCHDASTHVPLVISGPSFDNACKVIELVSLIDLPPTLLKCAGIPVPEHFMGTAVNELVNGSAKPSRDFVFIQISEGQIGRAIRTERWKYSVTAPDDDKACDFTYREDCLYDLRNDPFEKTNLINEPECAEVIKKLKKMLLAQLKSTGEDAEII